MINNNDKQLGCLATPMIPEPLETNPKNQLTFHTPEYGLVLYLGGLVNDNPKYESFASPIEFQECL